MHDLHRRKWQTFQHLKVASPRVPPVVSAVEPFVPELPHVLPETGQRIGVARDSVVTEVTAKLLAQTLMLLGQRTVPTLSTPLGNRRHGTRHAVVSRATLNHPVAFPGTSPVVRKTQEVERARTILTGRL